MRKKQLGNSEWPVLLFIFFGVILLMLWAVARRNNIPFELLLRTIGTSIAIVGLYTAWLYFTRAMLFRLATCFAAIFLWPTWWPVLTAMGTTSTLDLGGWDRIGETAWYATAWCRWGLEGVLGLIAAYLIWEHSRDQY